MKFSFVGLYTLICEAAEQLEAADRCCSSVGVDGRTVPRVRFGRLLSSSFLRHVLDTHDSGCIRSSHRVRSDVFVC